MSDRIAGLTTKRRAARGGEAERIVIFLHGYGADAEDLIGLADPLGPHLPGTLFLAPDAPERCRNNPMGFQWFPIPWLDGTPEAVAEAAAHAAFQALNGWLDAVALETGIPAERTALLGFSQGTMMALQVGLRRAETETLAGIVGFSGRLLKPETLAAEIRSKPPVLLVHGDADPVVPFASLKEAADTLVTNGVETYAHVSRGTAHGIAPDGLGVALSFLRERLGLGAGGAS